MKVKVWHKSHCASKALALSVPDFYAAISSTHFVWLFPQGSLGGTRAAGGGEARRVAGPRAVAQQRARRKRVHLARARGASGTEAPLRLLMLSPRRTGGGFAWTPQEAFNLPWLTGRCCLPSPQDIAPKLDAKLSPKSKYLEGFLTALVLVTVILMADKSHAFRNCGQSMAYLIVPRPSFSAFLLYLRP